MGSRKRGVFYCPSTIRPGETRRAKETVAELNGLWIDVDYKDIEGSPDDVDRALHEAYLTPTYVVASGNGRHAYWAFKEALEATPDAVARVEALLKQLAGYLGGDPAVCQCAVLMRLPGTHNTKRGAWKEATILHNTGVRYEVEDLEEWLKEFSAPTLQRKAKKPNGADNDDAWTAAKPQEPRRRAPGGRQAGAGSRPAQGAARAELAGDLKGAGP